MRNVREVEITAEGRDKGKIFEITEMPASKAEKWALRALLALSHAGLELPDDIKEAGMAGLATVSFKSLLHVSFAEAEPLLDEMMACIKFKPRDPKQQGIPARPLLEEDIEEVETRLYLRMECFILHTGFSSADVRSE